MKSKYGLVKVCEFCGNEFTTKPRYLQFCSTPCKNPLNRPGNVAWNKGIKLTEEQKAKQDRSGLSKGWGWNKGQPNEIAKQRMLVNNPNKDGRLNNLRPKNPITDPLREYRRLVRKATYRTLRQMKQDGERIPQCGKYKTDWQLDHIIPHQQGFELGINPCVLGCRKNLQFLKGEENRKKWDTYQSIEVVESIIGDKIMSYSTKVLDHYENPRNVGSFEKEDSQVGTGMVGAPACG